MNEDLIDLFVEECSELVTRAQDDLSALERQPGDAARLDDLYRAMHTLKGSAALFDWPFFTQMLHAAEDVLSAVRAGERSFEPGHFSALDACLTQTESFLAALAADGKLPSRSDERAAPVTRALKRTLESISADVPRASLDPAANALVASALRRGAALPPDLFVVSYTPHANSFLGGEDPVALAQRAPGLIDLKISARAPWGRLDAYDPFACNLRIDLLASGPRAALEDAFAAVFDQIEMEPVPASKDAPETDAGPALEQRMIRVPAERVDTLAHVADELIVAKNALSQLAADIEAMSESDGSGAEWARKIRDHQTSIGRLTTRLHAAAMSMRLVPVAPALRRLPRMARDLADRLGKQVDIVLDIADIQADKAVVDALSEPLLHLVRNALDHGVEAAEARRAAAKPERARLALRVRRAGDQMVIEIEDDGQGVDPTRIKAVALSRGLMPADQLDALTDAQAVDLVFLPGFSTASNVSETSGRGVGMDAVRAAVTKLGGSVTLDSRRGAGTQITLRLPLSIVLAQVAVVDCDGERFGVPMGEIVEIARVAASDLQDIRHGKAFAWRGRPVAVTTLEDLLGRQKRGETRHVQILVMQVGDEQIGLSVARFVERLDAVVKPPSGLLAGMRGLSGTTLMGDGAVLMVLNIPELIG